MKNRDASPFFTGLAAALAQTEPGLFAGEKNAALSGLDADYTTSDALIGAVQTASRMMMAAKLGLLGNGDFYAALKRHNLPSWAAHIPLKADPALQTALAAKLYNIRDAAEHPCANLIIGAGANGIAEALIERLMEKRIPFLISASDEGFTRLAFAHADEDGIHAYADYWTSLHDKVTNRIIALPNTGDEGDVPREEAKHMLFATLVRPVSEKSRSGAVMWTLTYFPTPADAEIDGIPYGDYLKLYFEMCDQPDEYIRKANDFLIGKLNAAERVHFTNRDGTDISMSLVDEDGRHFTFANSQTQRNVPGSEVFSAPRRDSLNGVIVARGKFMPKSDRSKLIEDLTLNFENGKIVSFKAGKGAANFQEFLDRHPNNSYVGELGIGTNPHLKRHVANGLLVEKISSSFHLALGDAYTITDYLGQPVHMNNGNEGIDHWDVTTMLGDMYLDGEAVMRDGKFLAPELDVLNRGWDAVPADERPLQWKDYAGPYTGEKE